MGNVLKFKKDEFSLSELLEEYRKVANDRDYQTLRVEEYKKLNEALVAENNQLKNASRLIELKEVAE